FPRHVVNVGAALGTGGGLEVITGAPLDVNDLPRLMHDDGRWHQMLEQGALHDLAERGFRTPTGCQRDDRLAITELRPGRVEFRDVRASRDLAPSEHLPLFVERLEEQAEIADGLRGA